MKICKIINYAIINLIIQSFLLYIFDVTFFEFYKFKTCLRYYIYCFDDFTFYRRANRVTNRFENVKLVLEII